jgi:AT hook motif
MPDRREKIDSLLAEVERESYARGWHDAIAALQAKAPEIPPVEFAPEAPKNETRIDSVAPPRQRGRPAKAINLVRDAIFADPGLRGVDITRALTKNGTPVIDRTVRSCLRRLRDNRTVWQRKNRWYPRPKERQDVDNETGGASRTPPDRVLAGFEN